MKTVINYFIVIAGTAVGLLAVFATEALWKHGFRRKDEDKPTEADLIVYRVVGVMLIVVCCYAFIHYLL